MKTATEFQRPKNHREISFSQSFDKNQYESQNCYQSPSIAHQSKIHSISRSKERRFSDSPLHNLHYKYLPTSKKIAEIETQSKRQVDQLRKKNDSHQKIQNFNQINKKITKILHQVANVENRQLYYCSKYQINIPESNIQISKFNSKDSSILQFFDQIAPTDQTKINMRKNSLKNYDNMFSEPNYQEWTPNSKRKLQKQLNKIPQNHSNNQYSTGSFTPIRDNYKTPLAISKQNNNILTPNGRLWGERSDRNNEITNSIYSNLSQKKYSKNKENRNVFVKGKNINNELQKIQQKINSLQKLKATLHINYEMASIPKDKISYSQITQNTIDKDSEINKFVLEQKWSRSQLKNGKFFQQNQQTNRAKNIQISKLQEFNLEKPFEEKQSTIVYSHIVNTNSNMNTQDIPIPKILRKTAQKKKNKNISKLNASSSSILHKTENENTKQTEIYSKITVNSNCVPQNLNNSSFKKQSYQCSWKEAQKNQSSIKNQQGAIELNNMLSNIAFQIKLDDQFRNIKKWFKRLKLNDKWNRLLQCLISLGQKMNEQYAKSVFTITSDQQNPFYNPKQTDFTIEILVKAFLKSELHWKQKIEHHYDHYKLEQTNFNNHNIDISGRGYINIEDLARYINSQLSTFYRNREFYLIYQRLKINEKLYFSQLITYLCKQ